MSPAIHRPRAAFAAQFVGPRQRRALWILGLLCAASGVTGCAVSREAPPAATEQPSPAAGASAKADASGQAAPKTGNLSRKIVRQAELELEVAAPDTTQTAIERLAEQHGGYVMSAVSA